MGGWEDKKPVMAMVGLQFCYAAVTLFTKAALLQGLNPRVLVVYRQALATLAVAPVAYISRRKSGGGASMGLRSFSLIFLASLIGVTISQNIYYVGLDLATSSVASATPNLVPAITFLLASIFGLERVNIGSLRSIAKIVGTVICVSGAIFMALFKGAKLLNSQSQILVAGKSLVEWEGENWLLGFAGLLGSACCWSIWLILQVPASAIYPDLVSLSAWMCFFGTLQSAAITVFLEPDLEAWTLHSSFELFTCLYVGVIGSGLSFFVQAWCIAQKGPLFSAMFNPLCTVIVTILAALFLHEEIYMGSLIGAVGIIVGLYVVLWGKAEDLQVIRESQNDQIPTSMKKTNLIANLQTSSNKIDLEQPLLSNKSTVRLAQLHENELLDRVYKKSPNAKTTDVLCGGYALEYFTTR
ncbi:Drug/metabolite transporter [Corchorus capsularis]|uniref:WAT1-related protein n=1 Tax=Corchorus capsularis TaxID=210143 RepID=A0A1R3GSH0_COCAP|nr:Drug/metabolite transporter [Corchorus capsularis]